MIPHKKEILVRELLAAGNLSQREIAERTGIARGTVSSIVHGTFHTAKTSKKKTELNITKADGFIHPSGVFVKCPECGGVVQMPCLSCYIAFGEKYPKRVLEVHRDPAPLQAKRRCIVCQEVKSARAFRSDVCCDGAQMHFSTCVKCRDKMSDSSWWRAKHSNTGQDCRVTGKLKGQ